MTTIHPEDERFAQFLGATIPQLDAPSIPVPREEMWTRIVAQRHGHAWLSLEHGGDMKPDGAIDLSGAVASPISSTPRVSSRRAIFVGSRGVPVQWALPLVAAVLMVGVGLGVQVGLRRTPAATQAQVAAVPPLSRGFPAQVATQRHFREVKLLLDRFDKLKASGNEAQVDAHVIEQAHNLLSTTQLLLDSPVGMDPQRRQLLTDVELVLMQITQLAPAAPLEDRDFVERSIEHSGVVQRLQYAMPATGKVPSGI